MVLSGVFDRNDPVAAGGGGSLEFELLGPSAGRREEIEI